MLLTLPAFGRDRVWDIEFFGYKDIDIAAVRKALPVHEGDVYAHDDTKNKVRHAVADALGRAPTDVQGVCCNENEDFVLFIGLPGSSSKNFSYNAAPEGDARLSEEITALQARVYQASEAAVRRGGESAREDDSAGYALSLDPGLRSLQLKVRDYALAHQDEVLRVLESSSDRGLRQVAAKTLGYTRKSTRQVQALVRAARDPDDGVRNEAVRALGVLASSDEEIAKQIPPESFIQMINAGIWTDRNKGSFVLDELTRARDPRLLEALQHRTRDSCANCARQNRRCSSKIACSSCRQDRRIRFSTLSNTNSPRHGVCYRCATLQLMAKIQRALLSVTDKTGIVDFARRLNEFGVDLISTGGTAKLLRESGIPVRDVSDVTGFPEMLDGRVKTMHPRITGGILAIRGKAEHAQALAEHGIQPIDMVVVNLYQFEKTAARSGVTLDEMIENIDIGGPTMIRSAAKNFHDVAVVVSPEDYPAIAEEMRENAGSLTRETQWQLAQKAFRTTAAYDSAISTRLAQVNGAGPLPPSLEVHAPKIMDLRYGENPHQAAALYGTRLAGIAGAQQLHGKELSYNNLVDLDAAWQLVNEFTAPAAAIIKHTNPAGCAEQATLAEAYRKALECDPVSAFGGVIGFNRPVDVETAREVAKLFVEAIAAPDYSAPALEILKAKKNLRLMKVGPAPENLVIKSISGGFLAQTADTHHLDRSATEVKTRRAPTDAEWATLDFAWKVAKHVKSNAIVYARAGQAVGVGAGQMSRVDSVKIGAMKAVLPLAGTVVASDAFFPFPDGVEEAASHGVTAIIQPGGSVRDAEVIAAADRLNLAMVFTGVRHFRH